MINQNKRQILFHKRRLTVIFVLSNKEMQKPYYIPGPYHTKEDFITNRFVATMGRNVKLNFPGSEEYQIRFCFQDEPPLFGLFGGATGNFEIMLERDKLDSIEYAQVTIILLNDKSKFVQRWYKSRLVSLLKENKHFNLMWLYSSRVFDLPR